jgi:CheY-like chemotaxis protein
MAVILIVDDEMILRQLFERVLRADGHEVSVAGHGREAIAVMLRQRPDVVLLDLNMPVMDGVSFLRVVRRRPEWKEIPVIVLSALADTGHVMQAREFGVTDYLLKSGFMLKELRLRLKKYLPPVEAVAAPVGDAAGTVVPLEGGPGVDSSEARGEPVVAEAKGK